MPGRPAGDGRRDRDRGAGRAEGGEGTDETDLHAVRERHEVERTTPTVADVDGDGSPEVVLVEKTDPPSRAMTACAARTR
ncbi:hypothetical protein BRD13_07020 [Halobacteriales archaeon SW_5_70_135]|nr:MAG: hypothetical protein BRD13_07020 [Halobacteriales archaeon SW_5_70_135]